jgi:hypothetical protein
VDKDSTVKLAANFIAAEIRRGVEGGWLGVSPEGKVILPLQPVGSASIMFPPFGGFQIRCPICQSGMIQPVAKMNPLSFLQAILSDTRKIKIKGFRCENKSCVLRKQIVPNAIVMEIWGRNMATK